ncbi:MAG: amidohydrolase family protein [Deltaproteobacteria bacterium]|nr:amidohydrolase family protein [Deltaproteobacteria bacterium]
MSKKDINLYAPRGRDSESPPRPDSRPVLHRARLVVPITQPAIEDGAVVVADGVILEVGPFQQLRRQWLEAPAKDHGETVLLPALVNGHAHLDLSGLAGQVQAKESMAEWIRSLLTARERLSQSQLEQARLESLASLHAFGTGIVGDIDSSATFTGEDSDGALVVRTFVELFGLQTESLEAAMDRLSQPARRTLADGQENVSLAVHAPYTASESLLRQAKDWTSERAKVISVHAAESEEEILFLRTGKGPLRDLLEERGMEPGRWQHPGCGAITYLDRLGFLDSLSLCVHVVQVSAEEIQLLQRSRAGVCLCPRSNLYIGNGLPPVRQLLDAGVPCALGTDSLASNADLNLFEEMTVLADQCGIGPDVVLAMATFHGARNLGLTSHYGSLEKNKRWLAIRVAATDIESVIAAGCQGDLEWLI